MIKIISCSKKQTQKVAVSLVEKLSRLNLHSFRRGASVVALEGNLGSGKTTFVQGFARALGVRENVLSPTFVLMKVYQLAKAQKFKHLIHIDCYRLDSPKDLLHLGFKNLLKDKDTIILVEWADRVRSLIPRSAFWIKFKHREHPHERILYISK